MNLRHLAYFTTIAELQSFAAAARRLNVSQPALTMRVKEMESEIGVRLFDRHSRGATLTEAGRELLPYAANAIRAFDDAANLFRGRAPRLSLNFGVNPTLGAILLPKLLGLCGGNRYPFALHVQQASSRVLMEQLGGRKLDAALAYSVARSGGLDFVPVYSESLVLIGLPDVVAGVVPAARMSDLANIGLVLDPNSHHMRQMIDQVAALRRTRLRVEAEVEPLVAKKAVMTGSRLCTIGPRYLYEEEIRAGRFASAPIIEPELRLTLQLSFCRTLAPSVRTRLSSLVMRTVRSMANREARGWQIPDTGTRSGRTQPRG